MTLIYIPVSHKFLISNTLWNFFFVKICMPLEEVKHNFVQGVWIWEILIHTVREEECGEGKPEHCPCLSCSSSPKLFILNPSLDHWHCIPHEYAVHKSKKPHWQSESACKHPSLVGAISSLSHYLHQSWFHEGCENSACLHRSAVISTSPIAASKVFQKRESNLNSLTANLFLEISVKFCANWSLLTLTLEWWSD